MDVFITVDTEVWPVGVRNWPVTPLARDNFCEREVDAYLFGKTAEGHFGVEYQCRELQQHGLKGTFFVDPLFSFALGLAPLREAVRVIEAHGHRVALHLHPEWLTDPRCSGIAQFKGPLLSRYPEDEQRMLIRTGVSRLREAGATPLRVFRAGSWGADVGTLRALAAEGINVDSSLNAAYPQSLPSLVGRERLHEPTMLGHMAEYPVTRIDDRFTAGGRHISPVGTTWSEARFMLEACVALGRPSVVIVLHSNEFVMTERLGRGRSLRVRQLVVRRFRRLCEYLARNSDHFRCRELPESVAKIRGPQVEPTLPRSTFVRTGVRLVSQLVTRWY